MVLAGLVIALGEVVDDAIIDVENILRRLRLNRVATNPLPAFEVVLDASLEVRSAVVYASLIVVLVFLPVFFLDGLAGTFFRPLAMTYMLAMLASLLVALTVTPALSSDAAARDAGTKTRRAVSWRGSRSSIARVLPSFVARPKQAVIILVVAFLATGFAWTRLGEEFLPNFQERDFLMHWVEKPGTSLDAMTRITIRASKELRSIPGVRNFGAHIGRAEVADEVVGPEFHRTVDQHRSRSWITSRPSRRFRRSWTAIPGLYRDLLTYLRERIKEVLTGASATIVVRIYGPDLATLRELRRGRRQGDERHQRRGVIEGRTADARAAGHRAVAAGDRRELCGLTPGQVRRAVTTLVKGTKVGEVFEEQKDPRRHRLE